MKKLVALAMALCMALSCTAALAEGETYKIGIVQFMPHVALNAATEGFKAALVEKLGEDAVTFVFQDAAGEIGNCVTITGGFAGDPDIDLIMANATPPLQSAMEATSTIPILGTSITDYATALGVTEGWTGVTGINVSGACDLAPLDQQAAVIKEIFPDAKSIGLLYCSAEPNSQYQVDVIAAELAALGYEDVRYFAFADSNDLASVTQSACDAVDVIYIPTDNTAATYTETVANVVIPAGKPVVAGEEGICSGCGVATLTIDYYDLGYTTGLMAYDVLVGGVDISTMAIQSAPQFTKKYNADIATKLGVTIPDGYEAIE